MVCRGDWPKMDHLTSNCHSVVILAPKESILSGCELCSVLNMPACSNGSKSLHCSLGEMGVVHITHTISSSGQFLEYGPPHFFEKWTGPYNTEWSILPTFFVKWTIWWKMDQSNLKCNYVSLACIVLIEPSSTLTQFFF